jgi:hypothetical protein
MSRLASSVVYNAASVSVNFRCRHLYSVTANDHLLSFVAEPAGVTNNAEILKNIIHIVIILPVGLYGCETRFLTPREEHRLTVPENRVLRRIFRPKRQEAGEDCLMRSFITFTLHR